ncbi:MAG: beta-ketoacyl-[acyl-carrier-protein] synthase II [Candidatus Marinimicrobia bacterium]|nr:beta-ketoacyl-[acyl-carrier-protein] synthase II [Candidatus Neomarinimicrobiota bacterium]
MPRRVVVTGLGVVSPFGVGVRLFWESLLAGKSGISTITKFDTSNHSVTIGGEVNHFTPEDYLEKKELNRLDEFAIYAIAAADEALKDAQLEEGLPNMDRFGVILGSGVGGLQTMENQNRRLINRGPRAISPFFIPMFIPDIAPGHISIRWGMKGPNYSVVSACASATNAIGDAYRLIQHGDADVILTGGSEAPITPISYAGFSNMKALSTQNENPQQACRPFDKERDGFVMGEGAGVLILEEADHAVARGATIYGEVGGYGATGDAHHITAPAPGGEGAVRAMRRALEDGDLKPRDIEYINAHGTSTPFNDKNETAAIKKVFGNHAKKINVSSTKSMTGHLLGASGGIEAVVCSMSILEHKIPPTINYENPDPDCDLNYTPNSAVQKEVNIALSNTFGFGGHNAVLVLKRWV